VKFLAARGEGLDRDADRLALRMRRLQCPKQGAGVDEHAG